ncbi:cyclin-dependent kinase inhibitor 1B-like [Oryzias latipes]|uniref:cyclin-dependent kinase inhibitor 1B-like n=1 Tax=Oryzias latipes TaxID=8090 RepID=UPI0002A4A4DC|nr:cyclin-dependent kinase inhibitor 1B-like [Oryzias latipes]
MERTKKSACRSLFGPVDHEQLRQDLQQELREMTERDSQRWNFDFQAGTPLPGGFQWEDTPADRAPALYRDSLTCPSGGEKSADTNQENCFNISNKCAEEKTPVQRRRKRRPLSKPGAKRKADARITDFFQKRKKTEAKSILRPFQPSSKETVQRRTMR